MLNEISVVVELLLLGFTHSGYLFRDGRLDRRPENRTEFNQEAERDILIISMGQNSRTFLEEVLNS